MLLLLGVSETISASQSLIVTQLPQISSFSSSSLTKSQTIPCFILTTCTKFLLKFCYKLHFIIQNYEEWARQLPQDFMRFFSFSSRDDSFDSFDLSTKCLNWRSNKLGTRSYKIWTQNGQDLSSSSQ